MNVQHTYAPEVTATLKDLAELSWRAASLGVNTDGMHIVALALLDRLLLLYGAQRGALLTGRYTTMTTGEPISAFTSSPRKLLNTSALHEMHEEDASALLATFSPAGGSIQIPPDKPSWLICRFPLSTSGVADNQRDVPFLAFLLLGWMETDDAAAHMAAEKACHLLPLVGDAVSSVLSTLLVKEHIRELEELTDRKALREMDLLKAEMLASVSHELRSPLASIKGYAATLLRHERRISREERHEFLLAINEASDRLAAVIDRLFEMSQLETGDIHIELTVVNLAYLVREAITALEQRFVEPEHQERQCTFTLQLEDERRVPTNEEPVIWADRHHLREVLDNLLDNAIHYSPEGGAIEVIIRPVFTRGQTSRPRTAASRDGRDDRQAMTQLAKQEAQRMVEICVRDHGIGIPPAHLERVFDRFHRVDTRLTREVNGMGLGLAICKRMVELHGGTIWAESDIGQGSTFHVWLPMDARLSR